jgi:hypothetical protein
MYIISDNNSEWCYNSVTLQLYKTYDFKYPFHFYLLCWYQNTLHVNMILREQMKSISVLDILFLCAQ